MQKEAATQEKMMINLIMGAIAVSVIITIIRNMHLKRILMVVVNFTMLGLPGFYFYKNSLNHSWEYSMLLIAIPVLTIKLITTISGRGAGVFDLFFDEKHTIKSRKRKRDYQPVNDPMRDSAF
jgi:hypothetical protein